MTGPVSRARWPSFDPDRIVFEDRSLLVVDKPSGVPTQAARETDRDDLPARLRAFLTERDGGAPYLGIHQRLDRATSGLVLYTRDKAANAPIAKQLEGRTAQKTYLAAVEGYKGGARRLEHRLGPLVDGRVSVVDARDRRGQEAITHVDVVAREGRRALLSLRLETGRTHQARAQLAAIGAPIAGDRLYGGARANRLMLHACALDLPSLGRRFECPVPESLSAWVARGEVGLPAAFGPALADALCLRAALFEQASAYRWVNGAGDELPGVVVDRYGDHAVLAVSSDEAAARAREIADALLVLGARGVYLKLRERADQRQVDRDKNAPPLPIAGEPAEAELVVTEGELRFPVRLADGLSTGLFVDQRDNRDRIRRLSGGRRVLNLFSYTCSFSVAAARGGAREVVSIDLSRPALDRGRAAFEENGLDPAQHRFHHEDCVAWLGRARRRQERFGLVILDPPSFGTRSKRATFDVDRDYGRVAADALALLEPGGRLLAVTNHRKTSRERMRRTLHEAARSAGAELRQLKDLPSPLDCPDGPDGPEPMKSFLVTLV